LKIESDADSIVKPTLLAIKLTGLIYEPALLSRATTALVNSSSYLRGAEFEGSTLFPQAPDLSEEDHVELVKLYQGLRSICGQARESRVRILVDAEQSWYQPA
jgi:proline dehydrogenase